MIHAWTDGSYRNGVGGWGVVLTGAMGTARYHGRLRTTDNTACEARAVLEAVSRCPEGRALTVHTDASGLVNIVPHGSRNPVLDALAARIREAARARGVTLTIEFCPRERLKLREAHDLAGAGRLRKKVHRAPPATEVEVRHALHRAEVALELRRDGDLRVVHLPVDLHAPLAPALQALVELVGLAADGERLRVRLGSPLGASLWRAPARILNPDARREVEAARREARRRGVEIALVDA